MAETVHLFVIHQPYARGGGLAPPECAEVLCTVHGTQVRPVENRPAALGYRAQVPRSMLSATPADAWAKFIEQRKTGIASLEKSLAAAKTELAHAEKALNDIA